MGWSRKWILQYTYARMDDANVDYSALIEKIETNSKAPKYEVNDRVITTKCKNIFIKGYTENYSR